MSTLFANETVGGVVIQVNPAQFPHKLVHIEIAPELPGCNCFVHELRQLVAPPLFHGEEPLTDEIGLGNVVEFEHKIFDTTAPCLALTIFDDRLTELDESFTASRVKQ